MEEGYIVPTPSKIHAQDIMAMPAGEMTNLDILKNPVLVSTVTWTVATQTPGFQLYSATIPGIFETIPNFQQLMLQTYTYFKPTVKVHFQMNSTKFHLGKLIAFYDPFESMLATIGTSPVNRLVNIYSATGQPNAILDAGYNNSIALEIPFEHILAYLTTNSRERSPQMGTVYLLVLNQLAAASGAPQQVTVNTLVSCCDVAMHLPIMPHVIDLTMRHEMAIEGEKSPKKESQPPKSVKKEEKGGFGAIFDNIVDVGKGGVGAVWNVITGNWSKAAKSAGQGFNSLGSLLGQFSLDKPADPLIKVSNQLAVVSPIAHMQGVDTSVRLAAAPMGGYLDTTFSAAPNEESQISEIIKTKMMFKQLSWLDSQAPGTLLQSFVVGPSFNYAVPASTVYAQTGYSPIIPTFLGYFSSFFEFWHGSIAFRFDFAATQFHSGRIIAVFFPNSETTPITTTDLTQLTNNPYFIFDLMEQKSFEVTIPYVSSTPRKRCVNPTNPNTSSQDELAIGTLNLYVYTELNHPDNVTGTVPYNCYIGAGNDFRYEVPRIDPDFYLAEDTLPMAPPVSLVDEIRHEIEVLPLRTEDRESQNTLVKGAGYVTDSSHFLEEINDVRDLARRYCFYGNVAPTWTQNTAFNAPFWYYNTTLLPVRPGVIKNQSTYGQTPGVGGKIFSNCMAQLYAMWSGSMRYKYVPFNSRTDPAQYRAVYLFNTVTTSDIISSTFNNFAMRGDRDSGYPMHITNVSQDVSLEVETPFYSYYNQCLTRLPTIAVTNYDDQVVQPGLIAFVGTTYDLDGYPTTGTDPSLTSYGPANIYQAIGDDFKFRFLVSPPIVYFRTLSA